MTDSELLELAAKAAGIEYHIDHIDGCPKVINSNGYIWNPLSDDGQALRLAVKCDLDIELMEDCVYANGFDVQNYQLFEWNNNDKFAATRRAIVRAAAEIGKVMK